MRRHRYLWSVGSAMGTAAVNYALWPLWIAAVATGVLFCHELGHYLAAWGLGGQADPPLFVPLVIGLIGWTTVWGLSDEARGWVYLAGPTAGVIAAVAFGLAGMAWGASLGVVGVALAFEAYSATLGSDGRRYRQLHHETEERGV